MKNTLILSFFIGIGGFVGSLLRYGLSHASQRISAEWPLGTILANILGCLAIGLISGASVRGEILSSELRLIMGTGFCGGFTTMSSMVYETAQMLQEREYLHAILYAGGTFALSMLAFMVGLITIRLIFKTGF
jgi:CrcB protein